MNEDHQKVINGNYPAVKSAVGLTEEEKMEMLAQATSPSHSLIVKDETYTDLDHPLMKWVDIDGAPQAVNWVLPNLIQEGVVAISGQQGIGKTSTIFPMACLAAGLIGSEDFSPGDHWRHVIYVTEDIQQVRRIAAGLTRAGLLDASQLNRRIKLVDAVKMPVDQLVIAGSMLRTSNARKVMDGQVEMLPLVVLDTRSATMAMEEENSNDEASYSVAALRQRFEGMPVWIVGHVAKTAFGRADVTQLSSRGANAWEADAHQTCYLVLDQDSRWFALGKTRFEAKVRELQIDSFVEYITVKNRFGQDEELALRFNLPKVPDTPRAELAQARKDAAKAEAHGDMRQAILEALRGAQAVGERLNVTSLRQRVPGKSEAITTALNELRTERWVIEIEIPSSQRADPRKGRFLYAMTTEQHDSVMAGGQLPTEATYRPPSWVKPVSGTAGNDKPLN